MGEKCRQCGKKLSKPWLEKTDGVTLCRDCFNGSTTCDGCKQMLPRRSTVTIKSETLCRDCMLRDELPIEVTLVRSSWTPWGDLPVIPVGDLLYNKLSGKKQRLKLRTAVLVPPKSEVG